MVVGTLRNSWSLFNVRQNMIIVLSGGLTLNT